MAPGDLPGGEGTTDQVWRQEEQIKALAITQDRDDVVWVRVIAVE